MQYELKKLPKSLLQITITVSDEKMERYSAQALEELSREVEIKGFRKGHIPEDVLKEHVGEKMIKVQAQDVAIKMSYRDVVIKENLPVIARPEVKIDSDEPLKFTLTVATLPEVEVKDYKGIKVKKEQVEVKEKEVEDVIESMKKHSTTYKEVDEKAKKDDRVEVDFEGFDEKGDAVPNTKSTNHPVILGSGTLIPGFEDELIGLKKGDKKEFDITFPKDYQKQDLQGKKLNFKVEIKMVEQPTSPELTEEFIEKMSGKKQSVDDFKKDLKETIQTQKETEAKKKRENEYIEKLLEKTKVELPDAMVDEEAAHILHEMKDEITARGMDFARFMEQAKTTEEELHKKYQKEGEKRIKIRLAIQHVIKEEGILVTDQEIADELANIKSMYPPSEHKKIEDEYNNGELRNAIENRLVLRKFFDHVLAE